MAEIWFTDVLMAIVFFFEVKINYHRLQELSDKPCEKVCNSEVLLRNGRNLVYKHFLAIEFIFEI